MTVDVDGGVHIDSVELDEVAVGLTDREMLAIPSHATWECSPTRS